MAAIYEPREDSLLLQNAIRDFFITHPEIQVINALDMGTGSGVLAVTLCNYCRDVLAVDVNPDAVEATLLYAQSHNIQNLTVSVSDLFSAVKGTFDIIIFNPPYLPFDPEVDAPDIALSAGERGNEIIINFLRDAASHLKPAGNIIFLFSSLSHPDEIIKEMDDCKYSYEQLASQKEFMEELMVYRAWRKKA